MAGIVWERVCCGHFSTDKSGTHIEATQTVEGWEIKVSKRTRYGYHVQWFERTTFEEVEAFVEEWGGFLP